MNIDIKRVKILVTIPIENVEKVRNAICSEGAGIIGNYTFCTSSTKIVGTFKPNNNANPYIGKTNNLEFVEEEKLEVVCDIENFFVNVAKKNNLFYFKDENNNVLIKKKGNIDSCPIALQAHLDMVCVKCEDSSHNFETDGIEVLINGDNVTAKDTSLGADQGVGLSMMLTILEDKSLLHPDLEFLFTTEEETTFKGAVSFPYAKVESKRLVNLDNSSDDSVFVGADGDICNEYSFQGNLIENDMPGYQIVIDGFPGGNSSEDIKLAENNAITTMARLLKGKDLFIKSINGGMSENDLAQSCEVVINTNLNVSELFNGINVKIDSIENHFSFSKDDTKNIINQILNLKCGYITENFASANLGFICTKENNVKIYYVFRSMDEKELIKINNVCMNFKNNFKVKEIYSDPVWVVNQQSNLLKMYKDLYYQEFSSYPKEEIWHGAIECAVIKNRINGLDIISIGSIIEKFHTIKETTYISSWVKTYSLLIEFLAKL